MCKNVCMSIQTAGVIPDVTGGDRLRMALRHSDVGVQEMADYLGVGRNTVSRWINDKVRPSKQTLRLWSLRCGVSLEWLETGQAPTSPSGPADRYTTRDSNPEPIDMESGELVEEPVTNVIPFPVPVSTEVEAA